MRKIFKRLSVTLLLCFALMALGCSQGKAPAADKPLGKLDGVIQISSAQVIEDFRNMDKDTIEIEYNNKKVQVVGKIESKWVMQNSELCVCIGKGTGKKFGSYYDYYIRVLFNPSQRDAINKMKDGDFIVVNGKSTVFYKQGDHIILDIHDAKIE